MSIRTRPYVDEDLPRLQGALAAWREEAGGCGYCHVGDIPHRIYENLRGRRPVGELVRMWEDDASIAGVAICGRMDNVFDVFTAPRWRATEAEVEMLRSAYETTCDHLLRLGRSDAWVVSDVFGCEATRADLLSRLGFERHRLWDHITERSLRAPIPAPRLPDGFAIRAAVLDDASQLASARNDAFDEDWSAETYRDEVMRKPGYDPERELVVVAPGGEIAAFTVIWLDDLNRAGLFEPVGTRRRFHRMGLARALMLHVLGEMEARGMRTAMVEHDAANRAALELYRGLGFEKRYETIGYRRAVSD